MQDPTGSALVCSPSKKTANKVERNGKYQRKVESAARGLAYSSFRQIEQRQNRRKLNIPPRPTLLKAGTTSNFFPRQERDDSPRKSSSAAPEGATIFRAPLAPWCTSVPGWQTHLLSDIEQNDSVNTSVSKGFFCAPLGILDFGSTAPNNQDHQPAS